MGPRQPQMRTLKWVSKIPPYRIHEIYRQAFQNFQTSCLVIQVQSQAIYFHSPLCFVISGLYYAMAERINTPPPPIGIDLGTENSCVGVWRNEWVEIIPNQHGNKTTPSCVAFTDTRRCIGEAAKNQAISNPSNTILS